MSIDKNYIFRIIILIAILASAAFLIFNENGILKFLKLRSEINNLDLEIRKAELKLQNLKEEIDSLNTKKEKIERVARERYHMMLPDENALRIEEK